MTPSLASASSGAFYTKLDRFLKTPVERSARQAELNRILSSSPVKLGPADQPYAEQYLNFGFRDPQGKRLVDRFLAGYPSGFTLKERREGARWQQTWFSLFLILSDRSGVKLDDMLLGGQYRTKHTAWTTRLGDQFVALCWLRPDGDEVKYVGHCDIVSARNSEMLTGHLRQMMEMGRCRFPNHTDRALLGELSWSMHTLLRAISAMSHRLDGATDTAAHM